MIIYVKQFEKKERLYGVFNIFKLEQEENKTFLYLPVNKKSRKRRIEKVFDKLCKYLYNNNIKTVVLEEELMKNEEAKNILYSNNIDILDGSFLSKYLVYSIIKKIYKYKNKNIQTGEITLLVNESNEVNIQTIYETAVDTKRLNIITKNIKNFKKISDYLHNELGILIKLSNNMKTNLKSSDIIVNIDFPEEIINKLEIPNEATILNIPRNININSKKFAGINIKSWQMEVPQKYKIEKFDNVITYEAELYDKTVFNVFKQIYSDNININKLVGVNGIINPEEFKKST